MLLNRVRLRFFGNLEIKPRNYAPIRIHDFAVKRSRNKKGRKICDSFTPWPHQTYQNFQQKLGAFLENKVFKNLKFKIIFIKSWSTSSKNFCTFQHESPDVTSSHCKYWSNQLFIVINILEKTKLTYPWLCSRGKLHPVHMALINQDLLNDYNQI